MEIKLSGTIMENEDADCMRHYGWTNNCCPADIERAIRETGEGEELTVWIDSTGGDLFAGLKMYHALKDSGKPTTARITTCAASAATVAMMGCDTIEADAATVLCIHDPSGFGFGTAEDMRKAAGELDTFKMSIIAAYRRKLDKTDREVWDLMAEDKWINAETALDMGLIDRMTGERSDGTVRIVNAGGALFFPTEEMRERYKNEKEEQRKRKARCAAVYAEILAKM